ncbi:MAG: DUF882 domain-containing protein [Campylobacterales bacterium]
MTRRLFLKVAAGALTMAALPEGGLAALSQPEERFLWLRRQGISDELKMIYFKDGEIVKSAYDQFCDLARDLRADATAPMDPNLMHHLFYVQQRLIGMGGPDFIKPITILSGYRTPQTNNSTEGAAKGSFHLKGQAIDFAYAQMDGAFLGVLAMQLQAGGVGFYRGRDFIHIDTGYVRSWTH